MPRRFSLLAAQYRRSRPRALRPASRRDRSGSRASPRTPDGRDAAEPTNVPPASRASGYTVSTQPARSEPTTCEPGIAATEDPTDERPVRKRAQEITIGFEGVDRATHYRLSPWHRGITVANTNLAHKLHRCKNTQKIADSVMRRASAQQVSFPRRKSSGRSAAGQGSATPLRALDRLPRARHAPLQERHPPTGSDPARVMLLIQVKNDSAYSQMPNPASSPVVSAHSVWPMAIPVEVRFMRRI